MLRKIKPIALAFRTKSAKQAVSLYTSMLIGIVLSILVSVLNTRLLGPEGYGDFKFLQNLFTFSITFLTLGIFVSGSRLIASISTEYEKRQIYGGLVLFIVVLYAVLVIGFFGFSYVQGDIFQDDLGDIIRLCLPLMFIFPMRICLENVLKGDNRIYELAIFRVAPTAIYLVIAYLMHMVVGLSVEKAIIIHMCAVAIASIIIILRSSPSFFKISKTIKMVFEENKVYGFNVYLGVLASVATTTLGGISLGYYIDNVSVGYFMLAMTMTQPLTMVSTSIGVSMFKRFANSEIIGTKVFLTTLVFSISSLVVYLLIIEDVILFLYAEEFFTVVSLCSIMAIGATFQGIGGLVNNFVCAKGYGRLARNTAFARGVVNVIGYTVGVNYYGLQGAQYTVLISGLVYMLIMLISYQVIKNTAKLTVE